jgi:mRNA interferase MazF
MKDTYSQLISNNIAASFSLCVKYYRVIFLLLQNTSAIRCDELVSILKTQLTDYLGILSEKKLIELGQALAIAVGID